MLSTFEEFKKLVEKQEEEIKKHGQSSALTSEALEKCGARLDEIETQMKRPAAPPEGDPERPEAKAWNKYLRKGNEGMTPDEVKVLTVSDDTTGGVFATSEWAGGLIQAITEISPIRSIASIRQTGQRSVSFPKQTATAAAAWVTETGTRSERTGIAFGLEEIPTHEMYHFVDVSQQDLEDAAFDIEGHLRTVFSEQFALLEGTAFVSGNGVGKPQGFLSHPDIAHTASGDANYLTADAFITCFYALKDGHARNASWVLARASIASVRKLKDGTGNYIWAPGLGLTGASGPSILGAPYVEAVDMPAVSAGLNAVAVGDFKRYQIVDRVGTTVLRDPYSAATTGCIRFHARRRVGGQTLLAEAIRIIRIEAS